MSIIVIGTLPSSLHNFRGQLLQCLKGKGKGIQIKALASGASTADINAIEQLGAEYINYPVSRSGLNPKEDFKTFNALRRIFNEQQPNVILAYTIKPIIWGAFAARYVPNCRFYALVTGLGFAFQKGNWKKNLLMKLVICLYKVATVNDSCVERTNFVFKPLNVSSK